jgi:hypothetical protein
MAWMKTWIPDGARISESPIGFDGPTMNPAQGSGAGLEGVRSMTDSVQISLAAQQELRGMIEGDDKGRRFVRIFIQGWG